MVERRPPTKSKLIALNLVWTIPLAVALGFILVAYARLDRCGIVECLGDPGGFLSPSAPVAIIAAAVSWMLLFAAIVAVPWVRPWWLRGLVGAAAGTILAAVWLYFILFTQLPPS